MTTNEGGHRGTQDRTVSSVAIGVFGISGIGKSTLMSRYVEARLGINHVVASDLIKAGLDQPVSSELLRAVANDTIQLNQTRLVDQFRLFRKSENAKIILLDAHSVIDSDDGFEAIPAEIIRQLDLIGLIFVHGEIELIAQRRRSDKSRTRPARSAAHLERYQSFALFQGAFYSCALGLPLRIVGPDDDQGLSNAIDSVLRIEHLRV